jgi:hypothetical protein
MRPLSPKMRRTGGQSLLQSSAGSVKMPPYDKWGCHKAGQMSLPNVSDETVLGSDQLLSPEKQLPYAAAQASSAAEGLHEDITALGELHPTDPLWSAHVALALAGLAKRVDRLEAER